MTDSNLIALLDARREEGARILALLARSSWAGDTEPKRRWDAMAHEVTAAMAGHPEFAVEKSLFFLSRQIGYWPQMQSRNLLEQAIRIGGKAAVEWYRKILNVTSADVDVISEVYGLHIHAPIEFSNGVRLIPLSELKDTPQARALISKTWVRPSLDMPVFPTAAIVSILGVPGKTDHSDGHREFLAAAETIRRTVTALTLSCSNAPTTAASWIDFHDNDLTAGELGYVWQAPTDDVRPPIHPVEVDDAAIEWAERFLALTGKIEAKCDVALARLNLARRRQTPGDKAVDGCIALEALLSDGQPGDLTFKLKLRAARLLGNSYKERQQISQKIGSFYNLRSNVVHGQHKGPSENDYRVASDGLALTLDVLRKIVLNAELPRFNELQLGPADGNEEF